jgi:ATP-dependent Clp protease adapter protein ClpS
MIAEKIHHEEFTETECLTHEQLDSMTSIIDQLSDNYLVAHNNDVTPFSVVFYILKTSVPMLEQKAYEKTLEIHETGEAIVYKGTLEKCHEIGEKLSLIDVEFEIF